MEKKLFHDRYFLERLLGRGNFSEVWLAKDMKTDIQVALKIYAPATGLDDHGLNVLSREFAIVVNANHKNLLKPLYYDSYDRRPYLVLPYCKNGSIQKDIGKFSEEQAWRLLHDVAAGLSFLHGMNPVVIHQDIKPDNIMVADDGSYMITDFGVSAHAKSTLRKSLSLAFASAGTTAYMGPERFSKDNTPIKANDIYSLGATVYEMLTGDAPFGDAGGLLQKRGADVPEIHGDFSNDLKRVVENCLQTDPWERLTAEQLVKVAEDGMNGLPVLLPGEKMIVPWYRKPWLLTVAVAVFLLAIMGMLKWCESRPDPLMSVENGDLSPIEQVKTNLQDAKTAKSALKELKAMSDDKSLEAMFILSRLYCSSTKDPVPDEILAMKANLDDEIQDDNKVAHEMLLQVVELDSTYYKALFELGIDYYRGEERTGGEKMDLVKSKNLFEKSLDNATNQSDPVYESKAQGWLEKFDF